MSSRFRLFDRTAVMGSGYIFAMVNRMQMLYYVLILPKHLVHPYMMAGILGVGVLSQINLLILAKYLTSNYFVLGYRGFVQLFSEKIVRFFALLGIFFILIKVTVTTLGYVEIVHQFMFPSMKTSWLIFVLMASGFYIASQGMEKTIRLSIIGFLATIWVILVYIPYFLPPIAETHHLYPLVPGEVSLHSWYGLLMVWSALSGPEYLVCLGPWIGPKEKILRGMSIGNALSVFEYLVLFGACLLYYGSPYLEKISFPVVNMIRYLQSPGFERVDLILISLNMIYFLYLIALFLLCLYGAIRIVAGRINIKTNRKGFLGSVIAVFICMLVINGWYWREGQELNVWVTLQLWLGAITYLLVPSVLAIAMRWKRRQS
ncbi:GerAB/ArcD/ProY family transporter [Fictibacillus enclensis]|uniref:GerAB/ArcD/ProY family transporter n=1 Tax=Fictibacillus enclensis TaxID=1017270 RepID=UPI0024BF81BD|nr:GerAB/ArcD/ProY family transporter [Fictibacillus enclensis]WHY71834.1 GerAB/ArcD/ProY family transporter [Fictibacillus enclensis]